jgi:chemotaxis signal transduction protein
MQAFANDTEEKVMPDLKDVELPLFSSNEIIFPDDSVERPETRYGYIISNMNFLVPKHTVSEIIQNANIFNLPNSPSWVEGLINLRGNIIPVMNLEKLLKNFNNKKNMNILVLTNTNDKYSIAMMIDDLPISLALNSSKTTTAKYPSELQDFVKDGFSQNNSDWVELDPHNLFKSLAES